MKRMFFKLVSCLGAVMLLATAFPAGTLAAGNATITVNPTSQTVNVGQVFTVEIWFDATNQEIDTASSYLNFDPNYIKVVKPLFDGEGNYTGYEDIATTSTTAIQPGNMTEAKTSPNDTAHGGLTQKLPASVDNVPATSGTPTRPLGSGIADTLYGMPTGGTPAFGNNFLLGTIYFKAVAETASTALTFNTAGARITRAIRSALPVTATGGITNGTVTIEVSGPDLVITQKTETWVDEQAGTYTVSFTVKNNGSETISTDFDVSLSIDGDIKSQKLVTQDLAAGATHTATFDYTATLQGDSDTIIVCADSGEDITETSETNNCLTNIFPVPKPDLVILEKSETWVDEQAGTYRVNYTVKNTGNDTAPAGHDVALYIDGSQTAAQKVEITQTLAPGATVSGTFSTVITLSDGSDAVKVCADDNTEVAEKVETNNCSTNIWPVPKPDLIVYEKSET